MNFVLRPRYILIGILIFAFLVRVVGIEYGLPLWLFDDEPSLVTSSLKMLEIKTLVPRFHQEEFKQLLYYPPYFSYTLLAPFSFLIGFKYIFFSGEWVKFVNYLLIDASAFFITARLLSIVLGMLTIWIVYKTAKQTYQNEWAAIASAFFIASSVTHTNLSAFAIHWIPATFFVSLGLWVMTNQYFSLRARCLLCALASGIGFGFSIMSIFAVLFIPMIYIFVEKKTIREALQNKVIYQAALTFLALAAIPVMLNPNSLGFVSDTTLVGNTKTFVGAVESPVGFLKPMTLVEPILVLFAALGLGMLFVNKKTRGYCLVIATFVLCYTVIFYLGFRFEERFTLPLIPILSLAAGYGCYSALHYTAKNKLAFTAIFIVLLTPIAASTKLALLKYHNDNRIQARNWIEQNITPNSKIITYANLTRIASTPDAITEQETIDRSSLRRTDKAEREFAQNPRGILSFHALNLYTVGNARFFNEINKYVKRNDYQYLLISAKPNSNMQFYEQFVSIKDNAQQIAYFGKNNNLDYFTSGSVESIKKLFQAKTVGLQVVFYQIKQ